MSTDDPAGFLPPHELRALAASLGDRGDATGLPHAPGPAAITGGSPGLAGAASAPGPQAPTLPADDPASIALAIARIAGALFGGGGATSLAPVSLVPESYATQSGGASPWSPGIAPQLAPGPPPAGPTEPIAPQHAAAPVGDPAGAGAPTGASSDPIDSLHALGSELRVPFVPGGAIATIPAMDLAATALPPLQTPPIPTAGAPASPQGLPAPSPASVPPFAPTGLPSSTTTLDDTAALIRMPLVDPDRDRDPDGAAAIPTPRRVESGRAAEPAIRPGGGRAFDPYAVRRDFPILDERVHGGKRLVWLDNAATTQKPRSVIERLSYYYEHENSNVHRAAHTLAARATDAYERARETAREFLNAPSASEIVFVRGATEGINLIAKAWGRRTIGAGDEIVLTHLEHHANIVPWQQLCADTGARLRVAPVDDRGDVILEAYERLLCSRTKLVAFTQVSNALGTITPAREMIEVAHRYGATVLLDGAQAVSHMPVDVQLLDCDFYVFSGHKVFAPTGIGAVFGKRALLEAMPPWQGGGNMIQDVTFEQTTYQQPPWRFEAGTGNIGDAAGLGAALDYVMKIGMTTIDRYEHELLVYATEQLATVPGLTMIGTSPHKAGVLSFVLAGKRTEDVGAALDQDGIAVRSGHHCAQPILRRFGVEASVRASLAFYNVREDIDALVTALHRLQAGIR